MQEAKVLMGGVCLQIPLFMMIYVLQYNFLYEK